MPTSWCWLLHFTNAPLLFEKLRTAILPLVSLSHEEYHIRTMLCICCQYWCRATTLMFFFCPSLMLYMSWLVLVPFFSLTFIPYQKFNNQSISVSTRIDEGSADNWPMWTMVVLSFYFAYDKFLWTTLIILIIDIVGVYHSCWQRCDAYCVSRNFLSVNIFGRFRPLIERHFVELYEYWKMRIFGGLFRLRACLT